MGKVTFGKRIKDTVEDTQAILLNGQEVGTLYARRTNNHNLSIGLCPEPTNKFIWSETQWFICEYAVLLNDKEHIWDLSKNGYENDARAVLSEVKKWVRAALAPAPAPAPVEEAPAPEAPVEEAPAPAPAPVEEAPAPAPAPVEEAVVQGIGGLEAAIIITAPSLRASTAALQGVGRTSAKRLRDEAKAREAECVLSRLFTEESAEMGRVTGRLSRGATAPEKIALSLARAAWRLEALGEGGREILFEERHILPNSYDWRAEGVCGSASLQWVKGGEVKGSIDYSRRRCITTTRGEGWTERLQIEGDKALAEKIGPPSRSWGGWITL